MINSFFVAIAQTDHQDIERHVMLAVLRVQPIACVHEIEGIARQVITEGVSAPLVDMALILQYRLQGLAVFAGRSAIAEKHRVEAVGSPLGVCACHPS